MEIKTITVHNQIGLRSREATIFVSKAKEFSSSIQVKYNHKLINGKSLLGVLSASIVGGATITIYVDGDDEIDALRELSELVECGLY